MSSSYELIAVDIGNSRIKLGLFRPVDATTAPLPEPSATFELPIVSKTGEFAAARLVAWCDQHVGRHVRVLVASVQRRAAARFVDAASNWAIDTNRECSIRQLTYEDVPMAIRVDEQHRVGVDRLLGALAANRIRGNDRAAIVIDHGTAITVDLVGADGAFEGGAILPGTATSARALAEQTDALPLVMMDCLVEVPTPVGTSTEHAIHSGLYWGSLGAIRELVSRMSADLELPPDVFIAGGDSARLAESLGGAADQRGVHIPHLVLSGTFLVEAEAVRAGGKRSNE
jgi:type III pantothenate kinase